MRVHPVRNTVTSLVAAAALLAAPLHTAWAGPAKDDAAKATEDAPAKKAAPEEDAADAEGEEAAPTEGEETEPAEGEEAAPAEGEEAEPAEGEETEPAEGEEAEGEETEPAEGEEDEEAEAEEGAEAEEEVTPEPPPQPEPQPEPVAEPDPESDRPDEPRVAGKPRTGTGLMIAGGAVLGAGIASTITFSMITVGCDIDGPLNCKYEDQDQFLIPLGAATVVLGTILLSVGVGYHMQYKRWQTWQPGQDDKKRRRGRRRASIGIPMPAVTKNGAGLGWTGRF